MDANTFNRDKEWDFILQMFPIIKVSDNILWKELYYILQCILRKKTLNNIDKEIYFSTKSIFLEYGKPVLKKQTYRMK